MDNLFATIVLVAASVTGAAPAADISPPDSQHCGFYGGEPLEYVSAFITRADRIVRARVTSVRDVPDVSWVGDNVVYELEILETLKGEHKPKTLELHGVRSNHLLPFDPELFGIAERHAAGLARAELTKTVRGWGRLAKRRDGKCEYVPSFDVGVSYLIFLPKPFTPISFEPVTSVEDAWFQRVLQELRSSKSGK